MAYYQLYKREDGAWSADFGDKDRSCVVFERDDHRDHGVKARDLRIERFERMPTTRQVMARQAELNR